MPTPSVCIQNLFHKSSHIQKNYFLACFGSTLFIHKHDLSPFFRASLCVYQQYFLFLFIAFACVLCYVTKYVLETQYSYNSLFSSIQYVSGIGFGKTFIKNGLSKRKLVVESFCFVYSYLRYPYQPRHWPLLLTAKAAARVISYIFAVGLKTFRSRYVLELRS